MTNLHPTKRFTDEQKQNAVARTRAKFQPKLTVVKPNLCFGCTQFVASSNSKYCVRCVKENASRLAVVTAQKTTERNSYLIIGIVAVIASVMLFNFCSVKPRIASVTTDIKGKK